MVRKHLFIGAALACGVALCGTGTALAQDRDPPVERRQERRDDRQERRDDRRTTEQPPPVTVERRADVEVRPGDARGGQAYRVKSVLGTKVSIQGGLSVGTVDDIVFSDEGYIDYLIVLNEGKYVVVPWQAAKFNFEQRAATVNITQQQFQQVPTFTAQQWPSFYAPAYREQIYRYYGLTPGQERRIERRIERRNP